MRWRLKLEEYDYEVLYKEGKRNTNADALSRTPQIASLQVEASGSKDENVSYSLFLQHALNDSLWKTDNIIPQISGKIKGVLVKEIYSTPRIKIILSETGNKTEDITLAPGKIKPELDRHPPIINLITRENETTPINLEIIFNCLIALKRYAIAHNKTTLSIAPIGDVINRIKISQIIKYIFKDTPIRIHLLQSMIQEINDSTTQQNILKDLHNSVVGGHKGITKTLKRIQQYYSWDGMKRDVTNFVKTCHDCQKRKLIREKTKAPMMITDTPNEAFEKIAIDIVGPLPETERGNKYILTTQDQLTKFCTAYPLLDTNSITIADTIVNKFIYMFGSPKELLSDQGSNISGEVMKEISRIF